MAEPPSAPDGARPVAAPTGPIGSARLHLIGDLGRGAHTVVHLARRDDDGARFAVKVLDQLPDDGGATLARFRREAALVASIGHPDLPRIHEVGTLDGRAYLVMDLIEGCRLADVLSAGPMPVEQVVQVALDLVGPLSALHGHAMVHRDVKPQNIMITPDGRARLIDFGLAARGSGPAGETPEDAGQAVGTLAYAAPEQTGMLRRPVDARADLYSLGVVLFECLSGLPPFPVDDVGELLRMHAVVPAPDLRGLVPGVPEALAALVARLLAKDPDDRYPDGAHVAAALSEVLPGAGPAPRPDRTGAGLAGRQQEYRQLAEAWRRAVAGHGGVAVIRGQAGVGKTRLAAALLEQAGAEGRRVLTGKAFHQERIPLAVLRRAADAAVSATQLLPGRTASVRLAELRRVAGPAAGVLAGAFPGLREVLGHPAAAVPDSQDELAVVVAGFLVDLARSAGGLVLHLDDVQWLDPVTERVLARLGAELGTAPLLLLCTARDDEDSTARTDQLLAPLRDVVLADLRLGPLQPGPVRELLAAALPGVERDDRLTRLLAGPGGGNPFLTLQYVHAVVDAGLITPSWGSWLLDEAALAELELPGDVLGLVLARLRGLGEEHRGLLMTAAAVGSRFAPALVADVERTPESAVLEVLADACARGLVEPAPGGSFGFVHDRIREALADLDPDALADRHQRIAAALTARMPVLAAADPDDLLALAGHTVAGRPGGDPERARAVCEAAARAALFRHDPAEAVRLIEFTHQLDGTRSPESLVLLGRGLVADGRFPRACEVAELALQEAVDPLLRGEALSVLAHAHRTMWRSLEGAEDVARGLRELGAGLPGNPLLLIASTLRLLLRLAFTPAWPHPRRPVTDPRELARLHLIMDLHGVGAYLGLTAMAPARMMLHTLWGRYWGRRLGPGPEYALVEAWYSFTTGGGGMRRIAARALARASRAAAGQTPALLAFLGHVRGATAYFSGADDGQSWREALRRHGRWMEPWCQSDALATLAMDATCTGHAAHATECWQVAGRWFATDDAQNTWFIVGPAMVQASRGLAADAAEQVRPATPDQLTPGNAAMQALVSAYLLLEQHEVGEPAERAIAQFEALRLKPSMLIRVTRFALAQHAMLRLTQCRLAAAEDREALLEAARLAVGRFRRVALTATMRRYHAIARADLDELGGRPARALSRLAGSDRWARQDAPLLDYEAARVAARASFTLGRPGAARHHVLLARTIARAQGWPHRQRWLDAEFGRDDGEDRPEGIATSGPTSHGVDRVSSEVDRRRLQALQEVGTAASRVLDPLGVARVALDQLIRILGAERALLFLTQPGPDGVEVLQPHLGRDSSGEDLAELSGYGRSLVERVRSEGQPLVITGTEEGAALGAQSVVLHGLRSILVAPLLLDRRLLGVVYLDSRVAKGIFTADDVSILTAVTAYVASSLETARAAELERSVTAARHERDLARQLQDLERTHAQASRLESLGRLAAGIAHEINTPVQFVAHNTQFLAETVTTLTAAMQRLGELAADPVPTGELASTVRGLLEEVDLEYLVEEAPTAIRDSRDGLARVTEIVRAMKDFAHPGAEQAQTDLNQAVTTTVQVCRNEWKYDATVELDLDPDGGLVACHVGELKQAVLNVVVNAAQAVAAARGGREDAPLGLIQVSTRREPGSFRITVRDDGVGMDEHVRQHAFDPFFTTRTVGEGTGQGLSQVHAVVVQHHRGAVELTSAPGAGTTVALVLPLHRSEESGQG